MDYRFHIYDEPLQLYDSMLRDIENARMYIYLETYKYASDSIGRKFRDALLEKCRQGVKVKILIDSWGTYVNESFFAELIKHGGEIRFFNKLKISIDFFTKNHKRNHRKILVIDDEISYIGSSNITSYSANWRELNLRIYGDITVPLKEVFIKDFEFYYNKYVFNKVKNIKETEHKGFTILIDIPSTLVQPTKKKYIELIAGAQKEIIIETPYFLPSSSLRRAMTDSAKRGVVIKVIMSKNSDVALADVLRNRYLGPLHRNGIKFLLYTGENLHSKVMLIDGQRFSLGSVNFDYRSFRFLHEISIIGENPDLAGLLASHINETLKDCEEFDYEQWFNRPRILKLIEHILVPFRHLF